MNEKDIQRKLKAAFDYSSGFRIPPRRRQDRHDFVFHMIDWLGDLQELIEFYKHPVRWETKRVWAVLLRFFDHAIPHLKAAATIFNGEPVADPFERDLLKIYSKKRAREIRLRWKQKKWYQEYLAAERKRRKSVIRRPTGKP